MARRLARAHGSRTEQVLGQALCRGDLGVEVARGLFKAELRYLADEECEVSADDV